MKRYTVPEPHSLTPKSLPNIITHGGIQKRVQIFKWNPFEKLMIPSN